MGTKSKEKKGGGRDTTAKRTSTLPELKWTLNSTPVYFAIAALAGSIYIYILRVCHDARFWWSNPNITLAEKEVSFMTEQALYYSYFKDAVDPGVPFLDAVHRYIHDDSVEYPSVVNALKRFNVWPEVLLAAVYRVLGVPGQPIDFYVQAVFVVNGLLAAGLSLAATSGARHWLAGVVAVLVPLANFFDMTRVWMSVPLRECWAVPFMFSQLAALTAYVADEGRPVARGARLVALGLCTGASLLCWQLASSFMALQVAAVFATHLCGLMSSLSLRHVLATHVAALSTVALLMFGNRMLLNSPYMCGAIAIIASTSAIDGILGPADAVPFPRRLVRSTGTGVAAIGVFALVRMGMNAAMGHNDDRHMFNLLRAKFGLGNFQDFHTSIYLSMEAFLAMRPDAAWVYVTTAALPLAGVSLLVIALLLVGRLLGRGGASLSAPVALHFFYGLANMGTAAMFYRLRLVAVPYLGILIAMLGAPEVAHAVAVGPLRRLPLPGGAFRTLVLAAAGLVVYVASGRLAELRARMNAQENFALPTMIELVDWLATHTPPNATIAGDMSTMSSVKLMAKRRIANHPHYEDESIRHKTYQIHHWFAYRSIPDVHKILSGMQSDYQIDYMVNHHPPCQYKLGRQQLTYADYVEMGEDGNPALPLPHAAEKCCIAVAHPKAREGYFELVRDTKEWPVYRVLPRTQQDQ